MGKRYTYQDVKEIVENANYELISTEEEIVNEKGFVLTNIKIKVWCKNPNHEPYEVIFNDFRRGTRCKKCRCEKNAEKLKHSIEYIKREFEKEGYKLLSTEYKNNSTKLLVQCDKGHEYEVAFNNFKQGRRCPYCAENVKYTYEEVKKYVESFGYELFSEEYENANEYILINPPCEHEPYEVTFSAFKNQGQRCPKCKGSRISEVLKTPHYEIKEYVESFGYELLNEECINGRTEILVKCPNPDHEAYEVRFSAFKNQNSRCPKCYEEQRGEKSKLSYRYIQLEIEKEGYKLLSDEYEDAKSKIKIKCPKGHEYETTWNKFQQEKRCPICNESKGEREITKILDKLNIKYIKQYRFEDCKFKQCLPFDFYLPKYNCCIEYDGRQHFEIVDYFGGLDGFIDTKIRDTIKNEYCKKNNIKLIRIPHWDYDKIEEILELELELELK